MAKFKRSIYRNPVFWEALADRAIRTLGQAIAAGAAASLFTGSGFVAFLVVVGVAVIGSVGTSLATPEKIIASQVPAPEAEGEQVT